MGLAWWLIGLFAFVTIIGIPFAVQHLKLAMISFTPIGQAIVSKYIYEKIRLTNR